MSFTADAVVGEEFPFSATDKLDHSPLLEGATIKFASLIHEAQNELG